MLVKALNQTSPRLLCISALLVALTRRSFVLSYHHPSSIYLDPHRSDCVIRACVMCRDTTIHSTLLPGCCEKDKRVHLLAVEPPFLHHPRKYLYFSLSAPLPHLSSILSIILPSPPHFHLIEYSYLYSYLPIVFRSSSILPFVSHGRSTMPSGHHSVSAF